MKRLYFIIFALGLLATAMAQADGQRGAVVTNTTPAPTGKVYALVVGISKYSQVVELKYANRDADAFVDFLESKAGGSVPPDNIKKYTDQDATRANIFDELYYLKSIIQPGDLLYFYFAGHGDIEQDLSEGEDALLLLAKSLPKNYLSGSEFIELDKLRSYISNFAKKGVNVVFIADACHSGAMLSGGASGRERTLHALEETWGNEIKFLSCQPNEVSEENTKWGGGRGIFSYTLEEGLKGLADKNGDSVVTVGEIKRYLESEVARQTDDSQNPDVRGDPKRAIAKVDMDVLLALRSEKQKALPQMIAMNTGRSAEDNLLAKASPEVKEIYHQFTTAIDKGDLLHPEGSSAMDLFNQLSKLEAPAELKRVAKRNFVSSLQDGAMLFIQNQLGGKKDVDDFNEKVVNEQLAKWNSAIENLGAAIHILGEDHYLTPSYKARKLYLEAYVLYFKISSYTREYTTANRDSCIEKLEQAVQLEENASYAYYLLGEVYSYVGREQKAILNYEKYLKLNPNDGYAFINLASLARREGNLKRADSLVAVAVKVGSTLKDEFTDYVAGYYYNWEDYDSAKVYYKKAIEYNPKLMSSYLNLGVITKMEKDYTNAEKYYLKALEIDSTYAWAYNNLANVYSVLKKPEKAIEYYAKAIRYDSSYHVAITNLAIQYENMKEYDKANRLYHLSKSIEPYYSSTYYGIGNIHYNRANYDSAILYYYYCTRLDTGDAKAYYWLGKSYEMKKDVEDALYYYQEATAHDTAYAAAWNAIGNVYYNQKEYDKAILYYSMAVVIDTAEAAYWTNLGKAYQYSDSVDLALRIFTNKALRIDSTYSTPYIQIGNIFYDSSEYKSAAGYYLKALHFDSTSVTALYNLGLICDNLHQYDTSIYYYRKVLKLDSTYLNAYSSLAEAYNKLQQNDSSKYYYLLSLKYDTTFSRDVYYNLGNICYLQKDSADAVKYFKKVLERTEDAITSYMLGTVYQEGGNFVEARKWYLPIENDKVFRPYVLSQYGYMEELDSNYEKSLDYYKQSLSLDSASVYSWLRIGYLLGYYLKNPQEGKLYIDVALLLDTANKNQSYTYMASNYFLMGDTATSLQWYFKAIEKNPNDLQAVYNIGCIYSLTGNPTEALKYLEKSFMQGYDNFDHIAIDTDLDNIRNLKEFKALVSKYKAKKKKG